MVVRKVQYAKHDQQSRSPSTMVNKGFALSSGKLTLEVNLDKDIYYHGDQIDVKLAVMNSSKKQVKSMKAQLVQHCEVTMVNKQFSRVVAEMETKEGCPITPGANLKKTFFLTANVANAKEKGVALDGQFKDVDVNLASTTLVPDNRSGNDALGVVISYSARVRLNCGTLGGELLADLPFKLLHPAPGSDQQTQNSSGQKARAIEGGDKPPASRLQPSGPSQDLIFEEFSKFRRGKSVDDL